MKRRDITTAVIIKVFRLSRVLIFLVIPMLAQNSPLHFPRDDNTVVMQRECLRSHECRCAGQCELHQQSCDLQPHSTPVMETKTMQLAAVVICATITGCFQYFGVDALSSNFLRHRRAVQDCQEDRRFLTGDSGSLRSPGFPDNYPNNVDCWTLIKVGEDKKVNLTFDTVDLEFSKNCKVDYVEVFDGDTKDAPMLGRLCQEKDRRSFESTSHSLLVHFYSDESDSGKGYLANFKTLMIPQGDCLWERSEEGGTISSPGHPGNYPSDSNCSVVVVAPKNSIVAFDIETLQLELDANCSFDFLTITEGTPPDIWLLGRFCGLESEPIRVESTGREVRVRFQSDYFLEFSGFKLRYRFLRPEVDQGTASFNVSVPEAVLPCDTIHRNDNL